MVTKVFSDRVDNDLNNPSNYNPVGLPQSGDSVALAKGSGATARGTLPAGVSINFSFDISHGQFASLSLQDATVPAGTSIYESSSNDTYVGIVASQLYFAGQVVNDGTLVFEGGTQTIMLSSTTSLLNAGTLAVDGSAPRFSGGAGMTPIVNDGSIRIVNRFGQAGQLATLGTALGGTGTVTVSRNAGLELGGAVSSGQTVQFTGGVGANASVQIDQPSLSMATIAGFVAGDTLTLANTAATATTYTAIGTGGTLQIYNGGATLVATLQFSGSYVASDFSLSETGSSLAITTIVTDAATGSTAPPSSSGIYRFFDTRDGAHFFTASPSERDNVLIGRPDLVEESNGFGAQLAASATTETVYRFFDTVHGTYFYTASAAERDQVIATRSDLTVETSSTFLEDATPQAGDVAVYRLFSALDGTHLYTASAGELSALTTPGSGFYRADLVPEGVSFYAPGGSYT